MKQVAQRARDGRIVVVDAPLPVVRPGWVLVANRCSLISAGTERSKLKLGELSPLEKARARPDLARKVVERARTEGIRPTLTAVRERLTALAPLGYSSAGSVLRVGEDVEGLVSGDRVACAGGGWANHAEVVAVPKNLVVPIPELVPFEKAAYATVGAVALHAVRQSEASLGDHIGVIGLGLVGQLVTRALLAAGCAVVGIDVDEAAVRLAADAGAIALMRDDPRLGSAVLERTGRLGLDAVLISADSDSADPLRLAAQLARDRGRLVIVGNVPVEAERELLYEKELEIRLSRSYGPGRYDADYEQRGRDLPAGYVRWTERRNLQAFLELVAAGRLDPSPLTTHRFPVQQADRAYSLLTERRDERAFGILLEYDFIEPTRRSEERSPKPHRRARAGRRVRVGLIGAGSFARRVLVPALRDGDAELVAVASESGLAAADVAGRYDARAATAEELVADDGIDALVVATRHSTHASFAIAGLRSGKGVFVEKPLALTEDELREVEASVRPETVLMVGFNRRFAPLAERLREELEPTEGTMLLARVNAGSLPLDHWLLDPEEGGGRLVGEGCHFVDLLSWFARAPFVTVHAVSPRHPQLAPGYNSFGAVLRSASGTVASLVYAGDGDTALPKERFEAFGTGFSAVLDDFRRLELYRDGRKVTVKAVQDKGHNAQVRHFLEATAGKVEAPAIDGYLASSRATLALSESARLGLPVEL